MIFDSISFELISKFYINVSEGGKSQYHLTFGCDDTFQGHHMLLVTQAGDSMIQIFIFVVNTCEIGHTYKLFLYSL